MRTTQRTRSRFSIPRRCGSYDEIPGRGFAIAFVGSSEGVEMRCYLRDEGEDAATIHERTALEKITLPQLFQYLEGITAAETAGNNVDR